MADSELSAVAGRDGLSVSVPGGTSASVQEVLWTMDAQPVQEGVFLKDINATVTGGANVTVDAGTPAGVGNILLKVDWTGLELSIGEVGHTFYRENSQPDQSVGQFGIFSTGDLTIGGRGLFNSAAADSWFDLNTSGDLYYRQSTGDRAPEISFGDISLGVGFSDGAGGLGQGTLGIDSNGIFMDAPFMDFDLFFDLYITPNTTSGVVFDSVAREPTLQLGWEGGIQSTFATTGVRTLRIGGGGIGYGSSTDASIDPTTPGATYFNHSGQYAARSEGLNVTVQWDYDDDFRFILGQAAGERARADFFQWERMGEGTANAADYDFRMPLILDAIGPGRGAGGICFGGSIPTAGSPTSGSCTGDFGGSFENVAPKDSAMAVVIRDGRLHAYNSRVSIVETVSSTPTVFDTFDWSLLYTFGKLDANLYFYPDADQGEGQLRSDVLLAIQSPGYWEAAQDNFAAIELAGNAGDPLYDPRVRWATNTHFMIADTDINNVAPASATPAQLAARESFGIGIINADLLWRVDDFLVQLVGEAASDVVTPGDPGYYPSNANFPGLWFSTTNLAQYRFRGLFGGGDLQDLSDPVRISLLDVNLVTDNFIFVLGPPREPGASYVAFDALLSFDGVNRGGTSVSLAEPSSPTASFTVGDISGDIMWTDGRVELKSSNAPGQTKPSLSINNNILIGTSYPGLIADPLVGNVKLGNDVLGQMVIPSGQIYSNITLTPQSP
ncbi:Uncharacterized protein (Fragment) [Durusdinium trenchii]|uniref:Uncharacterized protein n=1 Tax=Durusdinium trenchii TaxID=1381693 RepID=A0ABP0L0Z0_9DINO